LSFSEKGKYFVCFFFFEVNIQNVRGNRAIHMAIEKNQDDIVQFLILHGAEVNLDEVIFIFFV
jgi:ankyrin repeat protein